MHKEQGIAGRQMREGPILADLNRLCVDATARTIVAVR